MEGNLLKNVFYFNGHLWYKINKKEVISNIPDAVGGKYSNKLLKNDGTFKEFLIYDSTTEKIYYKYEFFDEFFEGCVPSIEELFEFITHIKFRVFRKIRIKMWNKGREIC